LRREEGESIQKLLSDAQRRKLAEMVGQPYDLSTVPPLTFAAPELEETDGWVNSKPLKLSDLRGKVVAFHFWAFNCINCVHNLPHYNAWQRKFASRGLVVIGMHTPETAAERDRSALEEKIREHQIAYPVASDHENGNWRAWANSMWPSVYLVDKRGRVRYWWYGELSWQGAQGEAAMRKRIENLLAEADGRPAQLSKKTK
jgi:peroxiredoxin